MTPGIDLHTHTNASDGAMTPEELVALAAERDVRILGITDHDTTDAIEPALSAAARQGLLLIPGVEISTHHQAGELHVLGYGIDLGNAELQVLLARSRGSRIQRAQRMLELLGSMGMPIPWKRVSALAGDGTVGRPHIAAALIEAGHVSSIQDAFDRYLGAACPAYVPREKISPCAAIAAIHAAGGVAALAHPADHLAVVAELAVCGLDGLEAYCTGYPPEVTARIVELAATQGLFCTGGSDFHGEAVIPENLLGAVNVPTSCYEALKSVLARATAGR